MKKLTVVASVLFALCLIPARIEAQNCGSEPHVPMFAKVECTSERGLGGQRPEGLPEGTPIQRQPTARPINGTCSASVKHGTLSVSSLVCLHTSNLQCRRNSLLVLRTGSSVIIRSNHTAGRLRSQAAPAPASKVANEFHC